MSIVHASILPELNDQLIKRENIQSAVKEIEGELYFMKPDTIVVLQTKQQEDDYITISIAECIESKANQCVLRNDLKLVMNIKAEFRARGQQQWLYLDADKNIDASIELSLLSLCEHNPKMKYVHIQIPLPSERFPLADSKAAAHAIGSVLLSADDRVALIAIATSSKAEGVFYSRLQKAITQKNFSTFEIDEHSVGAVGPFETTITSLIEAFHETQFQSRLLCTEIVGDSSVMVADLSMS